MMTDADMKDLQQGDIVRSNPTGVAYIVTRNFGGRVTAVRTVDMTNPKEWTLVSKANHEQASQK